MKNKFLLSLFSLFIFFNSHSSAQLNEWTWVNGDATSAAAVMGTQGVFDSLNHPAPQYESNGWTDNQGNFWYYTTDGFLWEYNPVIQQWAFIWQSTSVAPVFGVKGVPAATNDPGQMGFGFVTWTDASGDLWFFGAYRGGITYADLWRYNIATNMWTWMSGSNVPNDPGVYGTMGIPSVNNYPMGRCETNASWVDSVNNNLWLYGGDRASTYTSIGDLWRYNIATGEWTWMNGDTLASASPVYGVQNVADPLNFPGGRLVYSKWTDLTGNFYLFGGSVDIGTYRNDTWKYDKSLNQWTWKNGTPGINGTAFATANCSFDPANTPASDFENKVCWTDQCGNGWVFGTAYNNVWTYRSATGEWSLVKGNANSSIGINYGIKGVSSPANCPAVVNGAPSWRAKDGAMYFLNHTTNSVMWRYVSDPACSGCAVVPTAIFSAPNHICPGTCTDFTNLSQYATSYVWTFTGANPSTSTDINPQNICYNTPGNYPVQLIATSATGSDTLTLNNYIHVYPYPAPQGIAQSGDTLIANQGAVSYQWYHDGVLIPGATNYFYVQWEGGDFNVVATDANGCEVEAVIYDVVAEIAAVGSGSREELIVFPNPVGDEFTVDGLQFTAAGSTISIWNVLGEKIYSDVYRQPLTVNCEHFSSGIYWLEVQGEEKTLRAKFVKE